MTIKELTNNQLNQTTIVLVQTLPFSFVLFSPTYLYFILFIKQIYYLFFMDCIFIQIMVNTWIIYQFIEGCKFITFSSIALYIKLCLCMCICKKKSNKWICETIVYLKLLCFILKSIYVIFVLNIFSNCTWILSPQQKNVKIE